MLVPLVIGVIARDELLRLAKVYRGESYRYHRAGQPATAANYTVRARVVSRIGTGEEVAEVLASEIAKWRQYRSTIADEVRYARSIIMRGRDLSARLPEELDQ